MRVIIKHDRDDKGWIVTREGQFVTSGDKVHKDLAKACIAARKSYPESGVEFFVDVRTHSKLGNGMVMIKGEQDLQPVEFK